MAAEKTGKKQRGKPFQPGQSGNPAGRPKGARNKTTMAALALLDGEAEALTRRVLEMALDGDFQALKLCLERLIPPAKDRPVTVSLPEMKEPGDLPRITAAILAAVAAGEIGPTEAAALGKLVEQHGKAVELADIEARLRKLEMEVKK
ncbi:DUF5681 domain-containing protein [Desulfurivibrio sp. C05AmB]|uniref:DUF5681 domain-containing protein n=1 Tax=Desulfurivibrio sp. C05AmB TaxID=3374371 RepID=UPI00376EC8F5